MRADSLENVAIVDITGQTLTPRLKAIIEAAAKRGPLPEGLSRAANDNPAMGAIVDRMTSGGFIVVDAPIALIAVDEARTISNLKAMLLKPELPITTVLLAMPADDDIRYLILTKPEVNSKLEDKIKHGLYEFAFERKALGLGLSFEQAKALNTVKADITQMSADEPIQNKALAETKIETKSRKKIDGTAVIGGLIGYLTWIAVFSSSMLLLTSVIEEKSNRVLEVLLASTSTEVLLTGKVLGVAMVLLTVMLLWGGVGVTAARFGLSLLPVDQSIGVLRAISTLFSPEKVIFMLGYLVAGYLMFGMFFAVIGAFCETPKDAQAVIGPMMILLMIPMLALQTAFVAPDQPMIKLLSYFPLFSPFLMPVRLSHAEIWEVALTFFLMGVVTYFIMILGRKAFKQGALSSGKVSFKALWESMTQAE
jgi:ABC-2 type transport system permease protein